MNNINNINIKDLQIIDYTDFINNINNINNIKINLELFQKSIDDYFNINLSLWTKKQFLSSLENQINQKTYLLLDINLNILGFAIWQVPQIPQIPQILEIQQIPEPQEAELLLIEIATSQRGQGLANQLLEYCLSQLQQKLNCQNFFLEVRASNTAAQKLYLKHGFVQIACRKNYYPALLLENQSTREDALIMKK